ncbi:hypothetical protein SKC41_29625 [Mycobacterium sp. 050128]|uniref:hypothetical protein n=1 Tax=Mycobacterium sp. 050128 TaxID=3096112 RepID=UPI002ED90ACD
MGLLDTPGPIRPRTFTVWLADGTTWIAPQDQRYSYSIDSGVLTVQPVDADGGPLPGAQHYSPTGWTKVIEHDTALPTDLITAAFPSKS